MVIRITSRLTTGQSQRLRRYAARSDAYAQWSVAHVGRSTYAPRHAEEWSSLHSCARHLMVVAGSTFSYELSA